MHSTITRRVGILNGILRHYPSKRSDFFSDTFRVRTRSVVTKRVEYLPIIRKTLVKEIVEVCLRDPVGGVMIENILAQGDVGSPGRDQIAAPLRPSDAIPICMVRVGSVDPEQG